MKIGKINYIFDGDSFRLSDSNKTQIRLAGIDAPEYTQPFADKSKYFLFDLIPPNSTIYYTIIKIDKYNRIIGNVYDSYENLISEQMVKNGLAFVFHRYLHDLDDETRQKLIRAESYAKENKLGVWTLDNPQLPSEFHQQQITVNSEQY